MKKKILDRWSGKENFQINLVLKFKVYVKMRDTASDVKKKKKKKEKRKDVSFYSKGFFASSDVVM